MKLENLSLTLLSIFPVVGCTANAAPTADEAAISSDVTISDVTISDAYHGSHTVYTLSNVATGNAVLAFHRRADGSLEAATTTSTGGLGSDDALGSQGALAFAFDGHVLLAVNPGSNDVSSFLVDGTHLYLLSRVSSGGARPISVAAHDGLVYVLNAGSSTSVSGLYLDWFGRLHPLSGSTTVVGAGPAQVSFSPDGHSLVVTEKATNKIDTFAVGHEGRLHDNMAVDSAGQTPFGFAFTSRGQLVVSEAAGGAAGAGSVSSYELVGNVSRHADLITGPIADEQSAPCWIVITRNDRFAYASNTASGTISGYTVAPNGELTLFDDGGATAETGEGSNPIDMALDRRSRHLYVLGAGSHDIQELDVKDDGSLAATGVSVGVPATAVGLLAR